LPTSAKPAPAPCCPDVPAGRGQLGERATPLTLRAVATRLRSIRLCCAFPALLAAGVTFPAVRPDCDILLVEALSNLFSDLRAAVRTAAALGADEISNSYGGESVWSGSGSGCSAHETAEEGVE
jgi:hypothetical protein